MSHISRVRLALAAAAVLSSAVALTPAQTQTLTPAAPPAKVETSMREEMTLSAATLILGACESGNRDLACHIDTNGKESCGRYQYQWGTWEKFSRQSGITGSPLDRDDATRMTRWVLARGLGSAHWVNCFKKHPELLGAKD